MNNYILDYLTVYKYWNIIINIKNIQYLNSIFIALNFYSKLLFF